MENIPTLTDISFKLNRDESTILGCYLFGSQVYGTASEISDVDIVAIVKSDVDEIEFTLGDYNIHLISEEEFERLVKINNIKAIELIFAPQWAKLREYPIEFILNKSELRKSISHTVSNSWVKCKKKLEQGDYYIGIKSLFHSLRIASFGLQLVVEGDIVYSTMNYVWDDLNNKKWSWDELKEKYQPVRNSLLSGFRKYCEK